MTASNQDASDDCDPGEPRVTYESLSLGEEQCLEVKKRSQHTLKLNFTLILTVISVKCQITNMVGSSSQCMKIACIR